jgi:L-ornithine Nalpha-acyltransferase
MDPSDPHLSLRLATTEADRRGAERLRYEVFVEELGGDGARRS